METIETLESLGLSQQESRMYLSLLESGGVLASVAAKNAGIKRTTAYPILQALAARGLVRVHFKGTKRIYSPENPQRVATIFRRKVSSFEDIIPLLSLNKNNTSSQTGLRFIETLDEVKDFYDDIIDEYSKKRHREYCVIGNTRTWLEFDASFFPGYWKRRAKARIHTRLLLTEDSRPFSPPSGQLLRTVHFLPKSYQFKSALDIFEDKVLIVSTELSSLAVVIAIPAMVGTFQAMFDLIWSQHEALPKK
jgi:sugar-specific transcriptional regulator TrmB